MTLLLVAMAVSTCAALLPTMGPTTDAVIEGADTLTGERTLAGYEIVELSVATAEALRAGRQMA